MKVTINPHNPKTPLMYNVIFALLLTVLSLCVPMQLYAAAEDSPLDGVLLDRIVAVVGEDAIMQSELAERLTLIQQQLSQRSARLPPQDLLTRQVLERMIIEKLQLQLAVERGIAVDDAALNRAMIDMAARNRMNLPEFRDALVAQGNDYVKFREQIRSELTITSLRNRVVGSKIQITDEEIDELIRKQGDALSPKTEFRLGHILITTPQAATPAQLQAAREKADSVRLRAVNGEDFAELAVSESDGQRALEGGDLGWRNVGQLPTIFAKIAQTLETGGISELIRSSSGIHIVKLLDKRGGQSALVDQTHARHILVTPNAILDNDAARNKLAALKQRIENGEDFAELAKANSDDKASAVAGGDLGWANPGSFVPQFEEVMNSLEPGQTSEPFRSPFGWHILQVLERRQHDNSKEYLRSRAQQILQERKLEEETELWLRRLRDESYVEYRSGDGDQG